MDSGEDYLDYPLKTDESINNIYSFTDKSRAQAQILITESKELDYAEREAKLKQAQNLIKDSIESSQKLLTPDKDTKEYITAIQIDQYYNKIIPEELTNLYLNDVVGDLVTNGMTIDEAKSRILKSKQVYLNLNKPIPQDVQAKIENIQDRISQESS